MPGSLAGYKNEVEEELKNILSFWMENTIDETNGGFFGRLDNSNKVYAEAPKGSVLNSRILWAFSAAYNLTNNTAYLKIAERSFNYVKDYFIDEEFCGVYWTVNHKGEPLDLKKQFYALSFAIYGISEFYKCSKSIEAKALAIQLYYSIIAHSHDGEYGGYIEALSRDWKEIKNLRLSKKDANEKKSMNTHLHILEAFGNLYLIWPDKKLKEKIEELVNIFLDHIIDYKSHHLILFFDEKWNPRSRIFSYGHDIEAAWLIQEAAEIINNTPLVEKAKLASVHLANAASKGLDKDGGLWYEYEVGKDFLVKEKHSWPQAEAMVGFFNAWQITGDDLYLQKSKASWQFVKDHILDKKNGEWLWGVRNNYENMNEDKVGIWKCPYHNSRACIELVNRIQKREYAHKQPALAKGEFK